MTRVAVLGASGFVGSAVMEMLRRNGHQALAVRAPRLAPVDEGSADITIRTSDAREALAVALSGVDAVINAAGDSRPTTTQNDALTAANGVLPGLIASVICDLFPTPRFVHVSSAAVQGNIAVLDDKPANLNDTFSAYSRSKAIGERLVHSYFADAVVYRPPGVHSVDRTATQAIARLARSPLSCVAHPKISPSAQALLLNVASAIVFLATRTLSPPTIVCHPSEGMTTGGLLESLGGRSPRQLPRAPARALLWAAKCAGNMAPGLAGHRRRLEMLWFGQEQAPSWLAQAGWVPDAGPEAWRELGRQLAAAADENPR